MSDEVIVRATVPRGVKARLHSVLALREVTFSDWLRKSMRDYIEEHEGRREPALVTNEGDDE